MQGEGSMETNFQLLILSPNLQGGGWKPILNFDAESKFGKIPNSHVQGDGVGVGGNHFPTFDPESKFAKFPCLGGCWWKPISNFWSWVWICSNLKFPCPGGGGRGLWKPIFKSQLQSLVLSWNFHFQGWEVGEVSGQLQQKSTSKFQSKLSAEISISGGGGGGARVGHGIHGIWCCHLACIWGELTDFDTKFYNTFWASASQIVPFRNYIRHSQDLFVQAKILPLNHQVTGNRQLDPYLHHIDFGRFDQFREFIEFNLSSSIFTSPQFQNQF